MKERILFLCLSLLPRIPMAQLVFNIPYSPILCQTYACEEEKKLFEAVRQGGPEGMNLAQEALRNGALIHTRDARGDTPLCAASRYYGNRPMIEFFLSHGETLLHTTCGRYRETPLHLVSSYQSPGAMIPLLMKGRADPNPWDAFGRTPLHNLAMAVKWTRDIKFMMALLLATNRLQVNAQDNEGLTPLHTVVERGDNEGLAVMMMAGADIYLPDDQGETPLDLARRLKRAASHITILRSVSPAEDIIAFVQALARDERMSDP